MSVNASTREDRANRWSTGAPARRGSVEPAHRWSDGDPEKHKSRFSAAVAQQRRASLGGGPIRRGSAELNRRSMGVMPRVEQSQGSRASSGGAPDYRKSTSIVEVGAWTSFAPAVVQAQLLQQLEDESDENLAPPRTLRAAAIFADASGFTALTERLAQRADGAEQMCRIMNQFFGEVIRIVHEHGGDILKFAGDAVSQRGQSGPLGEGISGHRGLLRLRSKA